MVAIDDMAIFTILLPISMVVNALSYFFSMPSALAAPREPFSAILLRRILLTLDIAVSDAEKNADIASNITINAIFIPLIHYTLRYPHPTRTF